MHVLDGGDFEADRLERADGGFAAGAGTFDANFDFAHAVRHGLAGGVLGDLLRGVGGALARAFEADAAGAGPTDDVALHVGDGHLGVVESGENVGDASSDILRALGLDDLLAGQIVGQQFGSGGSGGSRGDCGAAAAAGLAASAGCGSVHLRRQRLLERLFFGALAGAPSAAALARLFQQQPSGFGFFFGSGFLLRFVSHINELKVN